MFFLVVISKQHFDSVIITQRSIREKIKVPFFETAKMCRLLENFGVNVGANHITGGEG